MQQLSDHRRQSKPQVSSARRQRDGGYLLLAIMLMMVMMIIAATVAAPRVVQQMKRDREEEMIHRGVQYARAIKKFYKKNGRYPASLDDLDKGQVKYLRQRYKDPLTKDGKWKLLNYADIATLLNTGAPGTPAAAMGTLGGANSLTPGGAMVPNGTSGAGFSTTAQQQVGAVTGGFPSNSDQGGSSENLPSSGSNNFGNSGSNNFGSNSTGGSATAGGNQGFSLDIGNNNNNNNNQSGNSGTNSSNSSNSSNGNQSSGTTFGSNSSNGQSFGGGAIVGVASMSKDPTIRIYNKKKKYNEWQFIYNPMMDQTNTLIKGPYQPTTIGGSQIGTPASQMNGQQQSNSPFGQQSNSPFGQSNSGFGQSSSGFGQQSTPQSAPQQQQQ